MKHVLVSGSGLSGLSCALALAEDGIRSTLVSPYSSERSQSVMAAGGINASLGKRFGSVNVSNKPLNSIKLWESFIILAF